MKNKFIVIEGTDCSGKETQSRLLVEKLNKQGLKAIYLTFPNYETPTGRIVAWYLNKPEYSLNLPINTHELFPEGATNVDALVSSAYFAADRRYNMPKIKEYLNQGYTVILDRYVYSNMAHQGGKITDSIERNKVFDKLETLEFGIMELPKPDEVIFLHMPYKEALELKKNRENLDDNEKDELHLKKAETTYLELCKKYNFKYIDCVDNGKVRSIEDINEELFTDVINLFHSDRTRKEN